MLNWEVDGAGGSFDHAVPEDKKDPDLLDKLRLEADGIFLFALEGLKRLMTNHYRFSETEANKAELQQYREDSDSVLSFVKDCCETGDDDFVCGSTELFNAYKAYCEESGLNRKLFDVMLQGSGDARMQPLYFLITTAGNDTNSICYEVHQKALDIQAGRKIDPTFYSVIYGADESEDWTDPKVWKKANPSLGITVGIDKVKAACESAKQNPGEENSFRQLRLNQWVKQSVRWMPMDKWDACAFPVNPDDLEGRVCYGGLDLSSTTDITAFVLVFPPLDEDDKYWLLPYFWVPEDTLDLRVKRDHVPYDVWERQGFIMTTEGNVIHYGFIEKFIEGLGEKYNIREIAFDRWGAVQMVQNLEGMSMTKTIEIDGRQVSFRASAAIPRIYRMKFHRDIYKDLAALEKAVGKGSPDESRLDMLSLEMFENIAYIMAKHADASVPDTPEEWLDGFGTFSIYQVLPQIIELWGLNVQTDVTSKKNSATPSGR